MSLDKHQYTIRFGIPALDQLISGRESAPGGIPIERGRSSTLSILGPDGTGKSVLGLHLASHYLLDHCKCERLPIVLYVSTDLSYSIARDRTWTPFGLEYPADRTIPFTDDSETGSKADHPCISLHQLLPLGDVSALSERTEVLSGFINRARLLRNPFQVGFVDLAANTAGDDWGFINRVLAILPDPHGQPSVHKDAPLHLLVIDAVEGFETLVGDLDAYGQVSSRRARIAQITRSAHNKCHVAFIVEESADEKRLPEEFVTDVVIRLRKKTVGDYIRRTVEVEKARGQEHVRGTHSYVIRSGRGSSTGNQQNVDDPVVRSRAFKEEYAQAKDDDTTLALLASTENRYFQSYFHVFSSLHHYSRSVMHKVGTARPPKPEDKFAAFGIRYLDNMLAGEVDQMLKYRENGFENMGLPCASVTALIGDSLTQKTKLGRAFLSRCFGSFAQRLASLAEACVKSEGEAKKCLTDLVKQAPSQEFDLESLASKYSRLNRNAVSFREDAVRLAAHLLTDSKATPFDGFAILLTSLDVDAAALAEDFSNWLLRDLIAWRGSPAFKEAVRTYCSSRTICRRLEIHDLPSAIFIHIVQHMIQTAQRTILGGERIPTDTDQRFPVSHRIRVVIDDFSAIMGAYPEIRNDPLFLPALLFHLRREGVTTLIIDTHVGQPGLGHVETGGNDLRTLVDQRLYTWHVPFYGENRVAIAPIPPLSEAAVRELRTSHILAVSESAGERPLTDDEDLVVDPAFEMYSGLEERRPQPVPLEIHIHEETEAFRSYMDQENRFYRNLFAPNATAAGPARDIIKGQPASAYESLQDFCYLEAETRLDHTLVFEVDEFWATRQKNALADLGPYLAETTTIGGRRLAGADPFSLFQPTLASSDSDAADRARFQCFPVYFPPGITPPQRCVDRVPFCWDFGFLLCRKRAWDLASSNEAVSKSWMALRKADDSKPRRREKEAHVSWYDFLYACREVARIESAKANSPIAAFDLSLLSPESLSCLVLEMWASAMYDYGAVSRTDPICGRNWEVGSRQSGLIELLDEGPDNEEPNFEKRLKDWKAGAEASFKGHWLALYKVWLLLGETLDLSSLVRPSGSFEFHLREAQTSAVASRQWYKTATSIGSNFSASDPVVVTQLPGRFSARGDWFLAVAKNSRSLRLAHRAIDLLSSRRANINRLQMGVGLPVRDIVPAEGYERSRTCLFKPGAAGERRTVSYSDLLYVSPRDSTERCWLWRSSLKDYDRHARVFQKWLYRMMVLMQQLRLTAGRGWVDNFTVVKDLSAAENDSFARRDFFQTREWTSMDEFLKRVKFLLLDLKQASPRSAPVEPGDSARQELGRAAGAGKK